MLLAVHDEWRRFLRSRLTLVFAKGPRHPKMLLVHFLLQKFVKTTLSWDGRQTNLISLLGGFVLHNSLRLPNCLNCIYRRMDFA